MQNMQPPGPSQPRRRRRGGRGRGRQSQQPPTGAAAPTAAQFTKAAGNAAAPAGRPAEAQPLQPLPTSHPPRHAAASSRTAERAAARGRSTAAAAPGADEAAWERTHLEQAMFRLARENADAAARSASATPPDRESERTHSLVSVLMAYFAVEAFINMVGQDRLGGRFRHYDRMSPEGKWLEVTRLVSKTGRTFEEEGKELTALSRLRSWRNTLTHYKGRYVDTQAGGETQIDALLSAENAKEAVETATMLYRTFYELDRRSPPRQFVWLDDRAGATAPRAREAPPSSSTSPPRTAVSTAGAPSAQPQTVSSRQSARRRRRRGGRGGNQRQAPESAEHRG